MSNNSHLTATDNNSRLNVTDNNSHLSTTNNNSRLSTTNNNSHLTAIGNNSRLNVTNNNSHIVAISSTDKPVLTTSTISKHKNTKHKNTKQLVENPPEHLQANIIKKLNSLSIIAIINNRVAFKDIEGSFQSGDVLDESGIKIIAITDSGVVLSTNNNIRKTLTMDWIND